jgi:hypothetical protein
MIHTATDTIGIEPVGLFGASSIDRCLVLRFFFVFSRAEFALKSAGLAAPLKYGGGISVKWDEFGRKIKLRFPSRGDPERVTKAVRYLHDHPPRRQVLDGSRLRWKKRPPIETPSAKSTIALVTTVRNNLFHGGKEVTFGLIERDQHLLEHTLVVLSHLIALHPPVAKAFYELGPAHSAT